MLLCTTASELTIGFKGKLIMKMREPNTKEDTTSGIFKNHFVIRDANVLLDINRSATITMMSNGIISQLPNESKNEAFSLIKKVRYSIGYLFGEFKSLHQ